MMKLDALIKLILSAESVDEVIEAKADLISLHADLAREYAEAYTAFAMEFRAIKEEAYKITVTETSKQAGERTAYRHKKIPEQIEAVKEAISLSDDKILLFQLQDR